MWAAVDLQGHLAWGLAATAAASLAVLLAFLALAGWLRQRSRSRRLAYIASQTAPRDTAGRADVSTGTFPVGALLGGVLRALHLYRPLDRGLAAADLRMSPTRYAGWVIAGMALSWILLAVIMRGPTLAALLVLVLGPVLAYANLRVRASRTHRQFEEELPEFLMLLSSSLRTGLSFTQALESLSSEGTGEVARQMRRAVAEVSMGATPDEALGRVADRMDSQDMRWAVVAIGIQRDVGGNLSNILDSVADTVRARETVRQEVHSLSAEGRLSAMVLGLLPVLLLVVFAVIRPAYVSILWTTPIGLALLAGSAVLMVVGAIWMARLVKVKA